MIRGKVTTKGIARTRKALKRINDRIDHPTGFLGYAGAQGHKEIMSHFAKEEGPSRVKWSPLAESTERSRRKGKKSGGNKILQSSGKMRASVVWMKFGGAALKFMALVKYAIYHHEGTEKMDERRFLFFPKAFTKFLTVKFAKYVTK